MERTITSSTLTSTGTSWGISTTTPPTACCAIRSQKFGISTEIAGSFCRLSKTLTWDRNCFSITGRSSKWPGCRSSKRPWIKSTSAATGKIRSKFKTRLIRKLNRFIKMRKKVRGKIKWILRFHRKRMKLNRLEFGNRRRISLKWKRLVKRN